MKRASTIAAATLAVALFLVGCSSPETDGANPGKDGDRGQEVFDNPTETEGFDSITGRLQPGDRLKVRLNRSQFAVREYPVLYRGWISQSGERLIVCTVDDPTVVVGRGDSGSPVLNEDNQIVAVLCYGYSGEKLTFLARAIEDLLAAGVTQDQAVVSGAYSPMGLVPFSSVDGFSSIARSAGTYALGGTRVLSRAATTPDPIAGSSIAVLLVSGDLVTQGYIGTATIFLDEKIYIFGHTATGSDQDNLRIPVTLASMVAMIDSYSGAFKLTNSNEQRYLGNLVRDSSVGGVVDASGLLPDRNVSTKVGGATATGTLEERTYSHLFAKSGDPDIDVSCFVDAVLFPVVFSARNQSAKVDRNTVLTIALKMSTGEAEYSFSGTYTFSDEDTQFSPDLLVGKVASDILDHYSGYGYWFYNPALDVYLQNFPSLPQRVEATFRFSQVL